MKTRKGKRKLSSRNSKNFLPPIHEIRFTILFGFRRKLTSKNLFENFKIAFGINTLSLVTVSEWYRRLQTGCFSVENKSCEGRLHFSTDEKNMSLVKTKIDENLKIT